MSNFDKVVFFDTETCDVNPRNYIISLSYRYYERGKKPVIGEILCNPNYKISPGASKVNGFTAENTKDYPLFPEAWKDIEPYFRDSVWVAHNSPFDCSGMRLEFNRWCIPEPHHWELDTLAMARAMIKKKTEIENHKLITLCKYFELEINEEEFHGSDYDILMTDKVFRKLKKLNEEKFSNAFDGYFEPKEVEGEYTQTEPKTKYCDDYDY